MSPYGRFRDEAFQALLVRHLGELSKSGNALRQVDEGEIEGRNGIVEELAVSSVDLDEVR